MENAEIIERIVRVETTLHIIDDKLTQLGTQDIELETSFRKQLQDHTIAEQKVMEQVLLQLNKIEKQTAHFKSMLGGVILTATSLWLILSQLFSWLHLDFFKLITATLSK